MIIIGQDISCITEDLDFHIDYRDEEFWFLNKNNILFATFKDKGNLENLIADMANSSSRGTSVYYIREENYYEWK